MKFLRCFLAVALLCAVNGVAKADDFQMVVIDPPPTNLTTYDITTVGSPIVASFSDCAPGEVPPGSASYIGCISFLNGSGQTITNLELSIPDAGGIVGQTAGCPVDPNDVFSNLICPAAPVGGLFTLEFTGGDITPGDYFVIAENGADPSVFPQITANEAPEPSSIWLLSTGVLSGGMFLADWRRRNFDAVRS